MLKIILLSLFSFICGSEGVVLSIDDNEYSLYSFYSRYPKKQWERADSLQKDKMYSDFVKRELCILEAEKLGLQNDPDVAVKIRDRSLQILVNESYEHFVATPLIAPDDLNAARENAKKELFASHILVGHAGAYLAKPPQRTLDEALLLSQQIKSEYSAGESFSVLAEKYSDDPGAITNGGALGWVQWGATVPEFQRVAFAMDVGILSAPVLTDFGYHLILITDVRPSELQYMSDDAYESYVINISKNGVRDRLREAALNYDSNKISKHGVHFDSASLEMILSAFNRRQQENLLSGEGGMSSASLLKSLEGLGVLCVYGGNGYGPKWFAAKLERVPPSRQPRLDSVDKIASALKTIILQDIAVYDGFAGGVDNIFSYKHKRREMISGLLYDAYLKRLVNSAPKPDTLAVSRYYEKNKFDKYMEEEKVVIREIKVSDRGLADSLLALLDFGADFTLLAQQYSSVNPGGGGLFGPFPRNSDRSLFDAASLLKKEEISLVLPSSNNSFSIIQPVDRVSAAPISLNRVYVRIESLLIKEGQVEARVAGVDKLLNKYSVVKNVGLLY
ncbi:MAG: peptidylprolyl isomerase [Candidatus Marinimicrobia bacterium]|nr:peptidylprolyl isomerase [Candidatus Neomarinimicrobiota bacterium]